MKMKFGSSGAYGKMIEGNWAWLNSKRKDGDVELNDSWMESNLGIWMKTYKLPLRLPKTKEDITENEKEEQLS